MSAGLVIPFSHVKTQAKLGVPFTFFLKLRGRVSFSKPKNGRVLGSLFLVFSRVFWQFPRFSPMLIPFPTVVPVLFK